MNATVARIVELLFEDLEMSEEVQAIKDEVMNNCQERYEDLLATGMSEDEATGAVVESLKGMEDVLREYPRKAQAQAQAEAEDDGDRHLVFPAESVKHIAVRMASEAVCIEASDDDMVHVSFGSETPVTAEISDGTLRISHVDTTLGSYKGGNVKFVHNKKTFAFKGPSFSANSLNELFDALKNMKFSMGTSFDDEVCICLPAGLMASVQVNAASGDVSVDGVQTVSLTVQSASGDVEISDVKTGSLTVSSASGDVSVDLEEDGELMEYAEIKTTSGDAEATVYARRATVQTISGDVEVEGRMEQVNASSTSGDISLRGDMVRVNFRTVSGDSEIICDSEELREITGKSTTGDIEVRLPAGVCASVNARSISGDVENMATCYGPQTATVNLQSTSGDIEVR